MITALRHLFVDSWLGRLAALLVFLAFIVWGAGSFYNGSVGSSGPAGIVKIGDRTIQADDLSKSIAQQLSVLASRQGLASPSLLPASVRNDVARTALQNLVAVNEVQLAAQRAGLTVPDAVIRQEVFALPAFQDAQGHFSRPVFDRFLAARGLTENYLIKAMREDITARAVLEGMGQSARIPSSLTEKLVSFYGRRRVVDLLSVPFTQGTAPEAPTQAQLHRFYVNHPWLFRKPQYRHARIVVMTPESVGKAIEVPDDVLRKLYDLQSRSYHLPETRTLQALTFEALPAAQQAASAWRGGASWEGIQKRFAQGVAASLPDARQSDIPDEALAKAVFAAKTGEISDPVKTGTGWVVFQVTTVKPPHVTTFDQAKEDLRAQLRREETPQVMQERLKQFQNAVAGSTDLEKIPADIGAVPAAGTLDEKGLTQDGAPAPIPGGEAIRRAVVKRIFSQEKGAPPSVVSLPGGGSFAVVVDEIHPGALKPLEEVRTQALLAWQQSRRRHAADARVTSLFVAAKEPGSSLSRAVAGKAEEKTLQRGRAVSLLHPDQTLPPIVASAVFSLKPGETAMLEAGDSFWLVTMTEERPVSEPDRQLLRQRIGDRYDQMVREDVLEALSAGFTKEVPPTHFNPTLFNQAMMAAGGGAQ